MSLLHLDDKQREARAKFLRNLLIVNTHGNMLFATEDGAYKFVRRAKKKGVYLLVVKQSCGYLVQKRGIQL